MAGLLANAILAQVRNVLVEGVARAAEVAVVEDKHTSTAESADRRNIVAVAAQGFAFFTATNAEEAAAEIAVFVEASTARIPPSAMPVTARRPGSVGFGIPPAARVLPAAIVVVAAVRIAANGESGATPAVDPKAVAVDAPGAPLDAGGAADLALEADLVGVIVAAIFAIAVVGFAGDGILPAAITTVIIVASTVGIVTDAEDGAAAAIDPETVAVDAPGTALDAGGAADLALQADLIGVIVAAILAVPVVGFTLDGVLRGCEQRKNKQSETEAQETQAGDPSHYALLWTRPLWKARVQASRATYAPSNNPPQNWRRPEPARTRAQARTTPRSILDMFSQRRETRKVFAAAASSLRFVLRWNGSDGIGGRTGTGAGEQEIALAHILGEGSSAFEFHACFAEAAELFEEIGANAGQEMVGLEGRFREEGIDEFESGLRTGSHGDGDGAIEVDDRGRSKSGKLVVERDDTGPVGVIGHACASVACGDRGLKREGARRVAELSGAVESGEAALDQQLVPKGAILIR